MKEFSFPPYEQVLRGKKAIDPFVKVESKSDKYIAEIYSDTMKFNNEGITIVFTAKITDNKGNIVSKFNEFECGIHDFATFGFCYNNLAYLLKTACKTL